MRAFLTVFRKEVLENSRDRRALWSSLLLAPLFGPMLFGFMVSRVLNQSVTESIEPLRITVSGAERAPGLMSYLDSRAVIVTRRKLTEAQARAAVRAGGAQVVLIVTEDYAARFAAGTPAPLLLFADSADAQVAKRAERTRAVLAAYGSAIAQRRLELRGVDPMLANPVAVNDVDVATPTGRAVSVLGFMTYFVLFAVLMGGLYLSIDSTAGERERGSLEPLLCLPVARSSLVAGKIAATCAYMCMSLALCLTAFVIVFHFVSLERLGMSANLGPRTALELFAICLPFVPLGAALMTLVASFTRTYREAQTYLGLVLLVPTLPIAFATIYALKTRSSLMFIPSLSQHLLMTGILKDEPLALGDLWVSAGASLASAVLLIALTARHWRRESLLG